MRPSDREIVEEIERQIAEGTDLDGLIPVTSSKPPIGRRRAVFSVRLGTDELASIAAAARKRGLSIGDFIRESAKLAAATEDRLDPDAAEFDLEAFQAEFRELGRKLDRSIAKSRESTKRKAS